MAETSSTVSWLEYLKYWKHIWLRDHLPVREPMISLLLGPPLEAESLIYLLLGPTPVRKSLIFFLLVPPPVRALDDEWRPGLCASYANLCASPGVLKPILNIVRFRKLMVEACSKEIDDFLTTMSSSSKEVEDFLTTGTSSSRKNQWYPYYWDLLQ